MSDLDDVAQALCDQREAFGPSPDWDEIARRYDVSPTLTEDRLVASVFLGDEATLLSELVAVLGESGPSDQKAAAKLGRTSSLDMATLSCLEGVFLYGETAKAPFAAKIGAFPTKSVREAHPALMTSLEALMGRVEEARRTRVALAAALRALALEQFGAAFLPIYARRKAELGVLDFDDLILRARDLLSRPGLADWVLYKLDGGIDHLLVDEAQDTSPRQWDIVRLLTQEVTSGLSARPDKPRTLFVVGDKKQSIYSFQGADPEGFDRMRDHFRDRFASLDAPFAPRDLQYSFRSAPAILEAVDATFADGNTAGVGDVGHRGFKRDMPGRVDLWPVFEPSDTAQNDRWDAPLDLIGDHHHTRRLAEAIADEIARMVANEVLWTDGGGSRPINEGDVMILVQRRSPIFHEIIRACKARSLAIAGADVLKLAGELAVRDLMALLRFLATPHDDLSLAAALRSPLFGWSEDQLFRVAHPRGNTALWVAVQAAADDDDPTLATLLDLRQRADFLRPYDLLARSLIRHGGRQKLIARLGEDAEDGIDTLLYRALAYETEEAPSLSGFIAWLDSGDIEVRRQAERGTGKIRVMTVHGAKGLEAPIVILPDTGTPDGQIKAAIIPGLGTPPVLKVRGADAVGPAAQALDAAKARQAEERQRLLYVAMTRAEQWLIVCGAGDVPGERSWHAQVAAGLSRCGAGSHSFPSGEGLRYAGGQLPSLSATEEGPSDTRAEEDSLPAWMTDPAAPFTKRVGTLSPSDLGGAKALPSELAADRSAAASLAHGTAVHTLLERLPGLSMDTWTTHAKTLLGESYTDAALEEALGVLRSPTLTHIFAPETLAEVGLTAPLKGARLQGYVDRLIVETDTVTAIDFKTNTAVPSRPEDTPLGLLRQMGAYAHALSEIYPNRRIETAILWTRPATLMPLPHALVIKALQSAPLA